jgi:hypothetical protein
MAMAIQDDVRRSVLDKWMLRNDKDGHSRQLHVQLQRF